ncbi:hypothetical protein JAAARDRAFT_30991 [Jaapia argillacea MUCL 33604]|uniref:G domain-containing protein n=1 Tax=Jaapia argillacea MUCL 33604 TaxID=933084 RepID=A0A067QG03_9AGAM|nr:hypothetical protein JAAARDRAFT_30991 [Jaapia argillacea MUCL 33604]
MTTVLILSLASFDSVDHTDVTAAQANKTMSSQVTPHDPTGIMRIAVIGGSGTGKTSFINAASGSNFPAGDSGLLPITNDLQTSPIVDLPGQRVALIDTPGLDNEDTCFKTFKLLEEGLRERSRKPLAGVIYLHKMDSPLDSQQLQTFRHFASLCVADRLPNVAILTTRWDTVSLEQGQQEENKVRKHNTFFNLVISKGAVYVGHYENTPEFAKETLRRVVEGARTLDLDDQILLYDLATKWIPCLR